jgi:hypothetical protein
MRLYILVPLAVATLSLLAVWFVNRRVVCHSALWPKGLTLSGPIERPDVAFDGELVLACAGTFGQIRCRSLQVLRGADVEATSVIAGSVSVVGRLRGVASLTAEKSVVVRGELYADDVRAPKIRLLATSRAVVLTVSRQAKIERHPAAMVKGFFTDLDEARSVDYVRRLDRVDVERTLALPS